MTGPFQSAFERDPELDPIEAPPEAVRPPKAAAPARRRRPVVLPAQPRLWSVTVKLELPVTVDGELLETITIRRPTGGDLAELLLEDDEEDGLNVRLHAVMCGLDPTVLAGLWADDGLAVAAACRPFLPASLRAVEPPAQDAPAA